MNPEELIQETNAATERLRETVREAHGVLRDLRKMKREMDAYYGKAEASVDEILRGHVEAGIKQLTADVEKVTKNTSASIYKRFDKIMAVLMGDAQGEDENLDGLAHQVRAVMGSKALPKGSVIPEIFRRPNNG